MAGPKLASFTMLHIYDHVLYSVYALQVSL